MTPMTAGAAATDEAVVEMLQGIEDKLYESGALVTATGDPECDVTIAFRNVDVDGATLLALTVQLTTRRPVRVARSRWEPLLQEVSRRYASLQSELPEPVREPLLDCVGPVAILNGTMLR